MKLSLFCLAALAGLGVSCSSGASAVRKTVEFTHTQDVGFGNEVCVIGPHPDLGGGNVLKAPKLAWNPGNVWRGSVAVEAGETLAYKFISRPYSTANWGNSGLSTDLTGNLSVHVPPHPAPPWGMKSVFLLSSWSEAIILYRDTTHNGSWTEAVMTAVGPGRTPTETCYRVDGLAPSGAELEFVFRNAANTYLNAPAPPAATPYQGLTGPYNFRTTLDVLFVQDQQVFNYRPPASPSAPTIGNRTVSSTVANIPGRPIAIYLPRGYTQNTGKRYPVVYFHDGQNVFFPGGPFGTWDADRIATYEISQGRMREAILVAIPNGNAYGSDRLYEYLPNGDTITGYGGGTTVFDGRANGYLQFLLDNVAPTLDVNYRTLGDAANTFVAGSSMGGLVSDYIGQTRSDRFGGVGIFSPAYWAAPNYVAVRDNYAGPRRPVRRYLSMGTAESSTGESSSNVYWQGSLQAYSTYLRQGHPVGGELKFDGAAGGTHSESAWARNLPSFYAFLLDPWREAQPLTLESHPPKLEMRGLDAATGQATLRFTARFGLKHLIQSSSQLGANATWTEGSVDPAVAFWEEREVMADPPAANATRAFWRQVVTP
ncbi:MAG: alpha/beta hydrolase-fold protein [Candidatus Methylacidiphilales bacterium]|nr:alpha/beta hydrolase-fold protein [Candidatus Methylacidiphilales bacterium]